ncbi:MAG: hypothetical protein HN348_15110 [Proteobacteria bacterium]|nr:hypothetical protein [Pseudomonadota bacterium]
MTRRDRYEAFFLGEGYINGLGAPHLIGAPWADDRIGRSDHRHPRPLSWMIERIDDGVYRLTRRKPPANQGLVDWLLASPEKGWFAA